MEIAPSENFTDCQQHPALAQMFMEGFLAESEDFIFDAGMNDVLELLFKRPQWSVYDSRPVLEAVPPDVFYVRQNGQEWVPFLSVGVYALLPARAVNSAAISGDSARSFDR